MKNLSLWIALLKNLSIHFRSNDWQWCFRRLNSYFWLWHQKILFADDSKDQADFEILIILTFHYLYKILLSPCLSRFRHLSLSIRTKQISIHQDLGWRHQHEKIVLVSLPVTIRTKLILYTRFSWYSLIYIKLQMIQSSYFERPNAIANFLLQMLALVNWAL